MERLFDANALHYKSSEIDWCEGNFRISSLIAEFWNTVSNVLFFIFPPLLSRLFWEYGEKVTRGVHLVWALLVIVGIGSVYFHATLSLLGQLLDEMAIIWVFMAAAALWCPKQYLPFCLQERSRFYPVVLSLAAIGTFLACLNPAINAFVLFTLGVPATAMLIGKLRSCVSRKVCHLGLRCFIMWVIALSSWISDKLFCSMWLSLGFPYMHCVWHIFIFLASYQACVLFAYFDAIDMMPEYHPVIAYWPSNSLWWGAGVPFVSLEETEESREKFF